MKAISQIIPDWASATETIDTPDDDFSSDRYQTTTVPALEHAPTAEGKDDDR